ncbi:MAG: hypothetical protein ACXABY_35885, partial [Candidatus Thorarchaeota archaeon]
MARALDYVRAEILRVAEELELHPNAQSFTRVKFLASTDVTKHDLETYGGFSRLKQDTAFNSGLPPIKDLAESRGVDLRNNYMRSLERRIGQVDYLSDKLRDTIVKVFEENPIHLSSGAMKPSKKPTERLLTLLLSDLHFGVDVDKREVFNSEFNWQIAGRRLSKMCQQAAEYKRHHRDITELQVVLNGDLIHGVVHLSEANLKPLTEQIWGATSALTQMLDFLRQHFKKIRVLGLPGNHGRTVYRSGDRALSQRWDSHSHSIFLGLKCAFRKDKGIEFDIPMAGIGTYETPGEHLIVASHGDTAPDVKNVGKALDVSRVSTNLLKMHAGNPFHKKAEVALFGHWHQPSVWMLQDGTICIVNGCLIGSDPYAQNGVGFFNSMPAQILFESVPGYPVGDHRIIQLRDADDEAEYDKIIDLN